MHQAGIDYHWHAPLSQAFRTADTDAKLLSSKLLAEKVV